MFDSIARQLRSIYLSNTSTMSQYDDYSESQTYKLIDGLMNQWDESPAEQKIQLLRESGHEFDSSDEIYYRSVL